MEATILDRFERLIKAHRKILELDPEDPLFERKKSVIRIGLEIPKNVSTQLQFIGAGYTRKLTKNLNPWIRGWMTENQVRDWWYVLDEDHDLDCGWLFFETPCNFYNADPTSEGVDPNDVCEWMVEIGTRKEEYK